MSEPKTPAPVIRGYTVTIEVISHRFNVEVEAEGLSRETAESSAMSQVKALIEREGIKILDSFDAQHHEIRIRAETVTYVGARQIVPRSR